MSPVSEADLSPNGHRAAKKTVKALGEDKMVLHCAILSDSEKERIHSQSLRILEQIGVRFHSSTALEILARNGARVDRGCHIARIPEEMVAEALKTAPEAFVLGARNPAFDFLLPSSVTGYTLDGAATFAVDYETGTRRKATLDDLRKGIRVFDAMPLGTVVWPPTMIHDVPLNSQKIRTIIEAFKSSAKHVQDELHHPREVPYLIEILTVILDNEDAIRERKVFSVCYCPIPPLTHDGDMCDAYLELVKYHIPILVLPMPACGSTGPASLYSNVAVANAEGLSALVLFQMASPGTPIIFGNASGTTDFSSGIFLEGTPEMVLQSGALGEMARFYHLPNTQGGCLSDAKSPGAQAVMEKMLTTLPLVLSGTDIINGMGEIEASQLLVLEQIVVDHEIAGLCRRIRNGIDTTEQKNLLAEVAAAQPGGHFLTAEGTLDACRSSEFLLSELSDRNTYEQWMDLGRPDLYSRAREKVSAILNSSPRHPLPEGTVAQLDDILYRADREL